jgi:hypothetical protein
MTPSQCGGPGCLIVSRSLEWLLDTTPDFALGAAYWHILRSRRQQAIYPEAPKKTTPSENHEGNNLAFRALRSARGVALLILIS